MPKLIITCGVSGSGKSTYAKELVKEGWWEINRDFWRFKQYCGGVQDWSLYKFTKEREAFVTFLCEHDWDYAVDNHKDVVVSNTNLNKKDHDYWKAKADKAGYEFEVRYFPITLTEAMKRDKKRGALAVGQDVLFAQWQKWLEISGARKYEPNENRPKAIILDIDGTVALTNGRSHYDYSEAVLTDRPRLDVIDLVETYAVTQGANILCVSGRSDICKNPTKEWLDNYRVDYSQLLMRKDGDDRCDTIIKEEIFWEDIAPYYNVIAAFDDRKRCIRKWIDLGIPLVLDVSRNYLEF